MNQDDDPGVIEKPDRHPGHELGAARERAGISLEEMAATLHLPADQVHALERDDYARLPPPAYVRGYLRAYAREVGMDADQVVADYDAVCGEAAEPELVVHPGIADPTAGRRPLLALLVVMAVAVAGALAWWLQQSTENPLIAGGNGDTESVTAEPAEPVQEEPAGAGSTGEPAGDEPTVPEAPAEPATEAPDAESDAEEVAEFVEPAATMTAEESPTGSAEPTLDEAPADASNDDGSADTVAAATTEEPVPESMLAEGDRPTSTDRAEEVATTAAAEGPDRLRIEVDGESWLEVFDARGRQLAYTLYSGDEPVILNGWAPFDVFLGNAPDVALRFGEREIDHSAFVRSDNTARFLVDAEGAGRR